MSRLKKVEIYAINWLNTQKKSPEEIANELSLKVDQVNKVLEKNHPTQDKSDNKDSAIKNHSEPIKSKSKDLMIRATSAKKSQNVSIMTKEASEYNDSVRNQTGNNSRTNNSIFRTKPNE